MAGTGTAHLRTEGDVLLRVENLLVEFPVGKTGLKVNAVSSARAGAARAPPAAP